MRIALIGWGYVGVSVACLLEFGHFVIWVDKDEAKILALMPDQIPIAATG